MLNKNEQELTIEMKGITMELTIKTKNCLFKIDSSFLYTILVLQAKNENYYLSKVFKHVLS